MTEIRLDALSGPSPAAVDFRLYHDPEIFEAEQQLIFHDTHRIQTLPVTPI